MKNQIPLNYEFGSNKFATILFALFLLLPCLVFAQTTNLRECANDHFGASLYETPDLSAIAGSRTGGVYEIPVVFHVIKKYKNEVLAREADVIEQIAILNEDFRLAHPDTTKIPAQFADVAADAEIEFCLAGITWDVIDYPTPKDERLNYIERNIKPFTTWNNKHYLNIWVIDLPGNYIGYSHLPEPSILEGFQDGVVVDYKYLGRKSAQIKGRTLVHEIGHYLGLQHVWGSNDTDGNALGCDSDDGIEDTPTQEEPYYGCPETTQFSCNSEDMLVNYMDYVDDPCLLAFTAGQVAVMRHTLETLRPELISKPDFYCEANLNSRALYSVYPNPFFDSFIIESHSEVQEYVLFDASGRKLLEGNSFTRRIVIEELAGFPAGMYYVVLTIGDQDRIVKLVKA